MQTGGQTERQVVRQRDRQAVRQPGGHLVLPVRLQQQRSRVHGGDLEDVLTDQRNLLQQLLIGRADDPNSVNLSDTNTLILNGEPELGSRVNHHPKR